MAVRLKSSLKRVSQSQSNHKILNKCQKAAPRLCGRFLYTRHSLTRPCHICADDASHATATITSQWPLLAIALHTGVRPLQPRRWPDTVPLPRLQLHFVLAKVMPMMTPVARAAAAMTRTPEDGIMDGDLGQEASHAHLGAHGQGDVRLTKCSPRHPSSGGGVLPSGQEAAPSKRVGGG